MTSLASNSVWAKVPTPDQESIKAAVGLKAPAKPDVSDDEALVSHLDQRPLSSIQAEIDAIAGRVALAIERAARLLEPKLQTVKLERSTLRDAEEVEAWVERQKAGILARVQLLSTSSARRYEWICRSAFRPNSTGSFARRPTVR